MNKRTRFTIIFSAPDFPYLEVIDWLSPKLSQLLAGACFQEIDGVWSEGGEYEKFAYPVGQQEKGMKILLSVTPDKQELAKKQIQKMLQALKDELNLSISWVHLEQEDVSAHHFKLL